MKSYGVDGGTVCCTQRKKRELVVVQQISRGDTEELRE